MSISTPLAVTNYLGTRQLSIIALLEANFPGATVFQGHRSLGAKDSSGDSISLPCFMVEAEGTKAKMDRMGGKWMRHYLFSIWVYLKSTSRIDLINQQTGYAEGLIKLFSNNANTLSDGVYKNYPGNWFNSEIGSVVLSPAFVDPEIQGSFIRAVKFDLDCWDSVIE